MNTATGLAAQISAFEPIANLSENGNDFADNGKDLLGQSNFCVPSEFLRSGYGPRTPQGALQTSLLRYDPHSPGKDSPPIAELSCLTAYCYPASPYADKIL